MVRQRRCALCSNISFIDLSAIGFSIYLHYFKLKVSFFKKIKIRIKMSNSPFSSMNNILENLPRPSPTTAKYSIGQTISYAGMDGK